jgi:hypothetical protein
MNPVKHGLGGDRKEWVYNIENDILFEGRTLKSLYDIIRKAALT